MQVTQMKDINSGDFCPAEIAGSSRHLLQRYALCGTCGNFDQASDPICLRCAKECHSGHQLTYCGPTEIICQCALKDHQCRLAPFHHFSTFCHFINSCYLLFYFRTIEEVESERLEQMLFEEDVLNTAAEVLNSNSPFVPCNNRFLPFFLFMHTTI